MQIAPLEKAFFASRSLTLAGLSQHVRSMITEFRSDNSAYLDEKSKGRVQLARAWNCQKLPEVAMNH